MNRRLAVPCSRLDVLKKRSISFPSRQSNETYIVHPLPIQYTFWAIPAALSQIKQMYTQSYYSTLL